VPSCRKITGATVSANRHVKAHRGRSVWDTPLYSGLDSRRKRRPTIRRVEETGSGVDKRACRPEIQGPNPPEAERGTQGLSGVCPGQPGAAALPAATRQLTPQAAGRGHSSMCADRRLWPSVVCFGRPKKRGGRCEVRDQVGKPPPRHWHFGSRRSCRDGNPAAWSRDRSSRTLRPFTVCSRTPAARTAFVVASAGPRAGASASR